MACISQVQCFNYFVLMMSVILPTALAASISSSNMSLPNCPDKCGNITIPYPFGIVSGCYWDERYAITCDNDSYTQPKAFFGNIELIDINITGGQSRFYKQIAYRCFKEWNQEGINNDNYTSIDITDTPYLFSNRYNKFTVIGCYTFAYIVGTGKNGYASGCASFCDNMNSTTVENGTCDGLGCCQTAIPAGLNYYEVQWGYDFNNASEYNPCMYAVLLEEDWYKFSIDNLKEDNFLLSLYKNRTPIILDWAIRDNGTCQNSGVHNGTSACLSEHTSCYNTSNGDGYLCKCSNGYYGNPYIPGGCQDIDECNSDRAIYPCYGTCVNKEGSYDCFCEEGTTGNASITKCTKNPEKFPYPARVATASIGGFAVLVILCVLLATYRQHKRHKKEKEEYKRYSEMMDNHLRVFSKKQIEIASNNFSEANILGTGGQGNVYKGLLENNKIVAIKKAKEVEETQRGEFVNEIILLSQLNHKNIVRLLGCCLEVKIPMLVYEYVPNGTLFDLLHSKTTRRPISLGTRLKIALESAMALEYLHSTIALSIIHGDVKSANILLDTDYTAKVSDFGASSVVPVNEIVELVHYSYGYLDPECLCTHIITKNSDVYSLGVVLLELVTRKQAIYVDEKGEKQSLATCFLSKEKRNEHIEMLDAEIVSNDENIKEILDEVSEIAVQCLSPKGEDRPTMRHVAEELHKLVRFHNRSASQQIDQEEMESLLGQTDHFSMSAASGFHSTQYSSVLEISTGAPR